MDLELGIDHGLRLMGLLLLAKVFGVDCFAAQNIIVLGLHIDSDPEPASILMRAVIKSPIFSCSRSTHPSMEDNVGTQLDIKMEFVLYIISSSLLASVRCRSDAPALCRVPADSRVPAKESLVSLGLVLSSHSAPMSGRLVSYSTFQKTRSDHASHRLPAASQRR